MKDTFLCINILFVCFSKVFVALQPNPLWIITDEHRYAKLAEWRRIKLGRIVLGVRRVECDWSQQNVFTTGDFAVGADNKNLDIPLHLALGLFAAEKTNNIKVQR